MSSTLFHGQQDELSIMEGATDATSVSPRRCMIAMKTERRMLGGGVGLPVLPFEPPTTHLGQPLHHVDKGMEETNDSIPEEAVGQALLVVHAGILRVAGDGTRGFQRVSWGLLRYQGPWKPP